MKKIILCPKASGNTYSICEYVIDNTECELKVVDENTKIDLEEYDIVILASGVYGNHVHKNIMRWINNIQNSEKIKGKVYLFLTWIGRGNSDKIAYDEVKEMLKAKNIKLEDNYITVYGRFMGIFKCKHPNEEDKKNVLEWVKKLN